MATWGLLLVNLGTPSAPETGPVRRYLREFLGDPRVLTMPALGRWLLLNLVILPFRPRKSAEAYEQIWTERGSPLLFHGEDLAARVQEALGDEARVVLAMRYGQPSIAAGLHELEQAGVERIVCLPLYPQYASSTWGSTEEKLRLEATKLNGLSPLELIPPFYDQPVFLDACAARARPVLERAKPERVVMSFHGLPESHIRAGDPSGAHCLASETCCDRIVEVNGSCYRAQCFATARGIAERLELEPERWAVTFQSRLGRTPWIRPYTDEHLNRLAEEGVERVVVLSPAFVADCLETLEELGLRAREDFLARGGKELTLVPSLNSEPEWVAAVVELVSRAS